MADLTEADRFIRFTEPGWAVLRSKADLRITPAGKVVLGLGAMQDTFCVLLSGRADEFKQKAGGLTPTGKTLGPGMTVAHLNFHLRVPSRVEVRAGTETRTLHLSKQLAKGLMREEAVFLDYVLRDLSLQVLMAQTSLQEVRELSLQVQFAKRLSEMAGDGNDIPLTQTQLAEMFGVTRLSISNALVALESLGFVKRGYAKVTVVDPPALSEWVWQQISEQGKSPG